MSYFFEGQNTDTWRVQDNAVRKWYHMPWMHAGPLGREVIHGLTRERNAAPGALGPTQKRCTQTWSIGFFNATAGQQLWKIWNNGNSDPDFTTVTMPEGAVVAKLIFNEANDSDAPFLKGSPTLTANTVSRPAGSKDCPALDATNRKPGKVQLVQVDIAVKDSRAPVTNWFFGTFAYRNEAPGTDAWRRLVPVGLTWGSDHDLSDADAAAGKILKESIILNKFGFAKSFDRGGRMNGPIDNPASSCMSCHQTAQRPSGASSVPPSNGAWNLVQCWFRDLSPTQAFGEAPTVNACGVNAASHRSLDFSLQLATASRNWDSAQAQKKGTLQMVSPQPGAAIQPHALKKAGAPHPTLGPAMIDGKMSFPPGRF